MTKIPSVIDYWKGMNITQHGFKKPFLKEESLFKVIFKDY